MGFLIWSLDFKAVSDSKIEGLDFEASLQGEMGGFDLNFMNFVGEQILESKLRRDLPTDTSKEFLSSAVADMRLRPQEPMTETAVLVSEASPFLAPGGAPAEAKANESEIHNSFGS